MEISINAYVLFTIKSAFPYFLQHKKNINKRKFKAIDIFTNNREL